jgi:hypothetical protein
MVVPQTGQAVSASLLVEYSANPGPTLELTSAYHIRRPDFAQSSTLAGRAA